MEKDNSGGSQTKVPSDQSDKERDKDKTMKIITPNPKEVENPLKKLRIITIILSIIVIFGVASYYLYSNTFQGRGTPPTLVGQKLEKFKSEEEFRKFIEEGEAQMESGMVGLMGRTPAMVSDEVSLEAPVGVGAEISREQTSQPYRVSETNVQVKGIDEPDILKTDGNNIYYSSQSFYRGVPEPLPLMELRSDIAPPFNQTPATKVVEAFPPENLKELSEIEDTGEMLLYQNYLIVFGNRKITGYDVSNITNPEKIWTSQLEDKNQIVTSRLMNDTIYLITSTGVSTFDPCVIPVMSGASTLRVSCTDIYRPPRTFPANSTYT
ncbi:MAG: beta-propeller domain-containing protein, partial [Candidatus Woesebacteria bacterium]